MVGLSMLWVPFIKYLSNEVYIYLQSVQAYISPPIAAVFLVGVFWPRANRYGAIASLVVGAVLGAARFVFELTRTSALVSGSSLLTSFVAINFLHFAILLFVVSLVVLVVVSLASAPETRAKLRGLTFFTLDELVPACRRHGTFGVHDAGRADGGSGALHDWPVGALRVS